jgi:Zn-dependent protease
VPILSVETVRRVWSDPQLLYLGLAFSLPTLFILLCHELGHWFVCRRHGLDATPPYFLPAPVGLGTFGAFIRIRGAVRSKRQLLDVGVSGPIAGFFALLPVLAAGIWLSVPSALPPHPGGDLSLLLYRPGDSLLSAGLTRLVHGELPAGWVLNPHPLLLAGWVGVFATMLNLLPLAQLDGGHVLYAALGKLQRRLAWPLWAGLALLGLRWPGWWLWCLIVLLLGLRHPRVADEEEPLDRRRRRLAWLALAIFAVTFMPEPIALVEIRGARPPSNLPGGDLDHEGHGALVDQLDSHARPETTRFDLAAELPEARHQELDERLCPLGRRRADERGTASTTEIRQQRELRDDEQAATDGGEIEIHAAGGILEDAHSGELLRRGDGLLLAVARVDTDQHQQPAADGGDALPRHIDRGARHALQD